MINLNGKLVAELAPPPNGFTLDITDSQDVLNCLADFGLLNDHLPTDISKLVMLLDETTSCTEIWAVYPATDGHGSEEQLAFCIFPKDKGIVIEEEL